MSKIILAAQCPTCARNPDSPYRVYDCGNAVQGCVDHFHTGHLVTPSESARWHARPEAVRIRKEMRDSRHGYVTEYDPNVSPEVAIVI
jgi:hypothetical protein